MSLFGHVAIGVATARLITPAAEPSKTLGTRMVTLGALALLPDIDFLLERISPSAGFLDHRGATHSFAVALIIGASIAVAIRARGGRGSVMWGLVATAVVASHGLLDYFGDSSLGIALLWPFSDARLLAPWHVLPNPSPQGLFSTRGLFELASEFVLFLPFWLYAFLPRRTARNVEN
jgi:inner membrane protein